MKIITQTKNPMTLGQLKHGDVWQHHARPIGTYMVTNANDVPWLHAEHDISKIHSVNLEDGTMGTSSVDTEVLLLAEAAIYING